jgi:hypothetical protein
VKSTARPIGGASDFGGEDRGSERFEDMTESTRLSDTGSQGATGDIVDSSQSFLFGPSSVTISPVHGMIDSGYFAKCMGRQPGEETVPEPHPDEVVVFEEFFSAGLRVPLHPILAVVLLKLQVQIHQPTPNAIVQLSKYIWEV